jgi:hypothetical protein
VEEEIKTQEDANKPAKPAETVRPH